MPEAEYFDSVVPLEKTVSGADRRLDGEINILRVSELGEIDSECIEQSLDLAMIIAEESLVNSGPQCIRVSREEMHQALYHPDTILWRIDDEDGRKYLPLFVPAEIVESVDDKYINKHFDTDRKQGGGKTYFFVGSELFLPSAEELNSQYLDIELDSGDVIVYEILDGSDNNTDLIAALVSGSQLEVVHDEFIDPKNKTPASLKHYAGLVTRKNQETPTGVVFDTLSDVFRQDVLDGRSEEFPEEGVSLLDPLFFAENPELQDKLWGFCKNQFMTLTENFPIIQEPTKEEFIEMLSDPSTTHVVYYHEGEPVSSCVFVHNMDACSWLRKDYFNKKYDGELIGYFPYLATDERFTSKGYASEVIAKITDLVYESGRNFQVLFECTNISADVVPWMVGAVVNEHPKLQTSIVETANYNIGAFVIS